jgi:hypothetical protein
VCTILTWIHRVSRTVFSLVCSTLTSNFFRTFSLHQREIGYSRSSHRWLSLRYLGLGENHVLPRYLSPPSRPPLPLGSRKSRPHPLRLACPSLSRRGRLPMLRVASRCFSMRTRTSAAPPAPRSSALATATFSVRTPPSTTSSRALAHLPSMFDLPDSVDSSTDSTRLRPASVATGLTPLSWLVRLLSWIQSRRAPAAKWIDIARRNIGHVDWALKMSVDVQDRGYTKDIGT